MGDTLDCRSTYSSAPNRSSRATMLSTSSEVRPVAVTSSDFVIEPSTRDKTNASVGPIGRSRMLTPLTSVRAPSRTLSPTVDSPRTISLNPLTPSGTATSAPPAYEAVLASARRKASASRDLDSLTKSANPLPPGNYPRMARAGQRVSLKIRDAPQQRVIERAQSAKMQRATVRAPAKLWLGLPGWPTPSSDQLRSYCTAWILAEPTLEVGRPSESCVLRGVFRPALHG